MSKLVLIMPITRGIGLVDLPLHTITVVSITWLLVCNHDFQNRNSIIRRCTCIVYCKWSDTSAVGIAYYTAKITNKGIIIISEVWYYRHIPPVHAMSMWQKFINNCIVPVMLNWVESLPNFQLSCSQLSFPTALWSLNAFPVVLFEASIIVCQKSWTFEQVQIRTTAEWWSYSLNVSVVQEDALDFGSFSIISILDYLLQQNNITMLLLPLLNPVIAARAAWTYFEDLTIGIFLKYFLDCYVQRRGFDSKGIFVLAVLSHICLEAHRISIGPESWLLLRWSSSNESHAYMYVVMLCATPTYNHYT